MKWLIAAIVLNLSVLICFIGGINSTEVSTTEPDMGVVIPYDNSRKSCNVLTAGLISRYADDPYSTDALVCIYNERVVGWGQLHDVEP